jgi:hypothetical protein
MVGISTLLVLGQAGFALRRKWRARGVAPLPA